MARPASPAEWRTLDGCPGAGDVLCGLDIQAGGTWFGVTRTGAVAVLTNFTEPAEQRAPSSSVRSRGALVWEWLRAHATAPATPAAIQAYLDRVHAQKHAYNGFNLVLSDAAPDATTLGYVTNRGADPCSGTRLVQAPGVHALSNSTLSTPWPKIAWAQRLMQDALAHARADGACPTVTLVERLFGVLSHSAGPIRSQDDMRRTIHVEPFLLTSTPDGSQLGSGGATSQSWYGTRTATVLLIPRAAPRRAVWVERALYELLPDKPPRRLDFGDRRVRAQHERRYDWTLSVD